MSPQDKAPAYQWYVRDYMSDEAVALMSYEQQGIYRALLDRQWLEGSIPADPSQLAAILRVPVSKFNRLWPAVAVKFKPVADGRLANGRMERERAKAEEYKATKAASGSKGAAKRWQNHGGAIDSPKANDSSSSASSSASASATAKSEREAPAPPSGSVLPMRRSSALMAGGNYAAHAKHAACNDRGLCVPTFLHDEFVGKANGDAAYVAKFYAAVLAALSPDAMVGDDSLVFWRAAWKRAHPSQDGKGLSAMQRATEAFIAAGGGK